MTWYDAPSHAAGAALVEELVEELARSGRPLPDLDVRATGVRLDGGDHVAHRLGLRAQPAADRTLRVEIQAADPEAVQRFWRTALGYDGLTDPLRRNPA